MEIREPRSGERGRCQAAGLRAESDGEGGGEGGERLESPRRTGGRPWRRQSRQPPPPPTPPPVQRQGPRLPAHSVLNPARSAGALLPKGRSSVPTSRSRALLRRGTLRGRQVCVTPHLCREQGGTALMKAWSPVFTLTARRASHSQRRRSRVRRMRFHHVRKNSN